MSLWSYLYFLIVCSNNIGGAGNMICQEKTLDVKRDDLCLIPVGESHVLQVDL